MKTQITNQQITRNAIITTILIVIASLLLCLSCSVTNTHAEGNGLQKTRIYVGKYTGVSHKINNDQRLVLTSDIIIRIRCDQSIDNIKPGTLCYLDVKCCKYDYHPDIACRLDSQYLVFVSGENQVRYRVVKNHKFY